MDIYLTNNLTNKKEQFVPKDKKNIGMYVCGPTVYGDAHLGHARPYVTFDLVYRYLQHKGYQVRYAVSYTHLTLPTIYSV